MQPSRYTGRSSSGGATLKPLARVRFLTRGVFACIGTETCLAQPTRSSLKTSSTASACPASGPHGSSSFQINTCCPIYRSTTPRQFDRLLEQDNTLSIHLLSTRACGQPAAGPETRRSGWIRLFPRGTRRSCKYRPMTPKRTPGVSADPKVCFQGMVCDFGDSWCPHTRQGTGAIFGELLCALSVMRSDR